MMRRIITYFVFLISILSMFQCGGDFGFDPDTTPPETPEITYITPGDGAALMIWQRIPSHDLTVYKIFASRSNAVNFVLTAQINRTDTSAILSGLNNGEEYFFRMTAVDDAGNESDSSNTVSTTPIAGGLPVPFITAVEEADNSIAMQWNPVISMTLDHFAVYLSQDGVNYSPAAEVDKDSLNCRLEGLANSIIYFIKMTSVNEAGEESEFSNIVSARPPGANFYLDIGWELFEAGNYEDAVSQFDTCLTYYGNQDNAARVGLGWSWAYWAITQEEPFSFYQTAANYFELADHIDARAGLTLIYNVLNAYEDAVLTGKQVISQNSDYQFSHDPFVDIVLIRLTVAQSAFELGDYAEVVAQLDVIDPGYPHNADEPEGLLERLQYVWETLYSKMPNRIMRKL